MKLVVVDVSVAAKWCLPDTYETHVTKALQLLADYNTQRVSFLVPELFWTELGNVLWKAVRKKVFSPDQAEAAYFSMRDLDIPTVETTKLVPSALRIATRHNRTVYDSLYVALAREASTELITADERLANALAAYLPVKWLGAL